MVAFFFGANVNYPRLKHVGLYSKDRRLAIPPKAKALGFPCQNVMRSANVLKRHFVKLCIGLGVKYGYISYSGGVKAYLKDNVVLVKKIKGTRSYAMALHELGHLTIKKKRATKFMEEWSAWRWAIENSLEWTHGMTGTMRKCLESYILYCALEQNGRGLPPDSHSIWKIMRWKRKDLDILKPETVIGEVKRNMLWKTKPKKQNLPKQ